MKDKDRIKERLNTFKQLKVLLQEREKKDPLERDFNKEFFGLNCRIETLEWVLKEK